MKTATTILSHLASRPQFKKLKTHECYQKYIKILSPKWQKAIAFVYVKDEILYVAVKHPGYKQELNHKEQNDTFISMLKNFNRYIEPCKEMKASKMIAFHSKYHPMEAPKVMEDTVPYYEEKAYGEFELPQEKELKEAFKKIQDIIQCNN